jgi:hypothetical protein
MRNAKLLHDRTTRGHATCIQDSFTNISIVPLSDSNSIIADPQMDPGLYRHPATRQQPASSSNNLAWTPSIATAEAAAKENSSVPFGLTARR